MPQLPPTKGSFLERGGIWVLAQSGLMLVVLLLGPLTAGAFDFAGRVLLAWLLCVLGAVAGISGAWVLGGNRTIFPRPNAGSALVRRGVYGFVRHPLYTSLMALSLGWGLLWQSLPTLLGALVLGVFLDRKARREEAWLMEVFPAYAAYAQRVCRFVPWIY